MFLPCRANSGARPSSKKKKTRRFLGEGDPTTPNPHVHRSAHLRCLNRSLKRTQRVLVHRVHVPPHPDHVTAMKGRYLRHVPESERISLTGVKRPPPTRLIFLNTLVNMRLYKGVRSSSLRARESKTALSEDGQT
ncbi:hypothetical protein ACLOJK_006059 [Asimina triloba]